MTPESNIQGVERPEMADIAVKLGVGDTLVIPRFCVRYDVTCESWSDERDPAEGCGADVDVEATTKNLGAYGP